MHRRISLFIACIALTLSGIALAFSPLLSAPVSASEQPNSLSDNQVSPARVRIVHTWTDHKDGAVFDHTEYGLGTAVRPSIILTHNHFDFPPERREKETLTLFTSTGQTFRLKMADIAVVAIDAGTQLIYLPNYVSLALAPVGDQASLHQLAVGEWLTVDYWDEAGQRFAQGRFQIKRLAPGVATLDDPLCVIRPGASGGGIYWQGKLLGNTWAMYADPNSGQPTGAFNVALLPAQALRLLQAEQASAAGGGGAQ